MTIHLVTFSDESMSRARELCMASAQAHGADYVNYWPWDAPSSHSRRAGTGVKQTSFYKQNESLLSHSRGLGFWAWKPYIIGKNMKSLSDADVLIYSDAGVEFINNVSHIIDRMDQDIFLFGNNWEHAHWCKRDVVEEIWPISCKEWDDYRKPLRLDWNADDEFDKLTWSRFGKQVQASVIFFRVSDYTRDIVQEWLDWCLFEGGRLIDDSPSRLPNHPEFREHRHDQSILTTLSYREGLRLHWWPAVYNRFVPGGPVFTYEKGEYQDDYPPLFHHHRLRDDQWPQHMLAKPTEAKRSIA